jgi:hypothetical protein
MTDTNIDYNNDSIIDSNTDEVSMLTTIDNPYNPFTQYDDWYSFDVLKGYFTCGYLARIAKSSDELSKQDERAAIQLAINEIVEMNVLGIYLKVTKDNFKKRIQLSSEIES